MTESVSLRAYAKITLFLRIKGKEETHHDVEALQQSVDLFDEITLSKQEGSEITSDYEGDNSLVVLRTLAERFSLGGMHLSIRKNIPIGGGLGGSSADAAAAALACAELWRLDHERVKRTVANLFGDLAFQMTGGTALARGFGDDVETLPALPRYAVLLAFPEKGVSTAEAYALSDSLPKGRGSALSLYGALARGEKADRYYLNDLLPAASILNDEIAAAIEAMRDNVALLTGMSGSGSTLFSLYARREDAEKKAKSLSLPTLVTETLAAIR
ncbi:MAG: hypothetical protein IJT69_04975 [Clostridia bacterium]|nr:hypothetical protein [Clostridia bacterium]